MHMELLDKFEANFERDQKQVAIIASYFANQSFRSQDSDPIVEAEDFIVHMRMDGEDAEDNVQELTDEQTFEFIRMQNMIRGGKEVVIDG